MTMGATRQSVIAGAQPLTSQSMRSVLRGRQNDVELWRSETRSEILRSLAREFRTMRWTTRLFEVLLEELHLDEELERLLGEPIPDLNRSRYAEAIAIGLILRHSWHPNDLAAILERLAVPARPQKASTIADRRAQPGSVNLVAATRRRQEVVTTPAGNQTGRSLARHT